jgi:plasmanylethanolamine desaturase
MIFAGEYVAKFVACIVIADFLSGFFHWLEDAYGREYWPITGRLVTRPNILHHHEPRYFTRHSWLKSASVIMVLVAAGLLAAWAGGFLGWMTWTVALIDVNANESHKWAHRTPSENGRLIRALQWTGLLQSPAHHARHQHRKNTHYCVITDYLNPLLDAVHLWDGLEWLVYRITGVRRRHDDSVTLSNSDNSKRPALPPSAVVLRHGIATQPRSISRRATKNRIP